MQTSKEAVLAAQPQTHTHTVIGFVGTVTYFTLFMFHGPLNQVGSGVKKTTGSGIIPKPPNFPHTRNFVDPAHDCPLLSVPENCTLPARDSPSHALSTYNKDIRNLYDKPQADTSTPPPNWVTSIMCVWVGSKKLYMYNWWSSRQNEKK